MKTRFKIVFALSSLFIFSLSFSSIISQEAPDYGKILGDWDMEVDAEGEYYYLSFNIEKDESGLNGTISESTGFFSDSPLSNIQFDGEKLSFEFTAPTPPDGLERVVKAEFKVADNEMEGYISIEDLGLSIPANATREIE